MNFFIITPQDDLFRTLALILTYVLIGVKFSFFVFYLRKYQSDEIKNKIILGFSLFFLFLACARIFYMVFDFYLTNFNPFLYQTHILVWKIATLLSEVGIGILLIISEKKVFQGKDKYFFFICYVIFVCIGIVWPEFEMAENFATWAVMFAAFILFSYIYLAVVLEGEARKRAILVVFGLLLYTSGSTVLHQYFIQAIISLGGSSFLMYFISPILKILAAILLALGFLTG
ncbi:MAG: hypothetical protein ACTSO9_15550 [Candidatus Helarchaeota archaeon]